MKVGPKICLVPVVFLLACSTNVQPGKERYIANIIPENYLLLSSTEIAWKQDTIYCKGIKFSGYGYTLYPNSDTLSLQGYWQGLQEGLTKKWYPNRQLAEYRMYVSGKKEGVHKAWWPNGAMKFLFTVSNDAYTGDLQEWNIERVLVKWFHYKDGQELGSQRLWWDDGSVRANYVIRNGKKYGLIGVKLCSNPYDSINKK